MSTLEKVHMFFCSRKLTIKVLISSWLPKNHDKTFHSYSVDYSGKKFENSSYVLAFEVQDSLLLTTLLTWQQQRGLFSEVLFVFKVEVFV